MDASVLEVTVDSPTSPKKETLDEKGSDGAGSPQSERSSPEANCPICLGKPENKSFTDSCLHQFCFSCLLEWSKVKPECPLCKQGFKSIIHTVRSIEDYEQYYLSTTSTEQRLFGLFARYEPNQPREPFRYRTTAVTSYLDYFVRLEEAISQHVIPSVPTHSGATHWQRRRQLGTSDFRRNIYQQGLWVQQTRDITGRIRDCSPEFYRANAALVHRLVPWLNRELNVLCSGDEAQVQHVIGVILELVKQVPIRSQRFSAVVAPFIGRHSEHFVHEFYCFASSPYDLIGYDRHANYVSRDLLAHEVSTEPSGSDSDVQIVGPFDRRTSPSPLLSIQLDSGSDSEECVVVDSVPARQPTAAPEVITLESDPDDDIVQVNIHIGTDPNRPGPSTSRTAGRKRNWVSVQNVQVPSSSNDNVNVSINIAHPNRPRSLSVEETFSDSSTSVWSPYRKKTVKTKIKREKSKKKKGRKSKCLMKLKRKRKAKEPSSSSDIRSSSSDSESSILLQRKRKPSVVLKSSSDDDKNDAGNSNAFNAHEVTDDYLSSSSGESEYKHRLRSVVIKSSNNTSTQTQSTFSPENSPPSSRADSHWNGDNLESHNYDYDRDYPPFDPDVPESSNASWTDPFEPGCSRRSSFSSSSSEYPKSKKCKYSKSRFKR